MRDTQPKTPGWFGRGFISKEKYESMDNFEKISHHLKMGKYGIIVGLFFLGISLVSQIYAVIW